MVQSWRISRFNGDLYSLAACIERAEAAFACQARSVREDRSLGNGLPAARAIDGLRICLLATGAAAGVAAVMSILSILSILPLPG
jgi:hypothetical protein